MRTGINPNDSSAQNRTALPQNHPLIEQERQLTDRVTQSLERTREARDNVYEQVFTLMYSN